MREVTAGAGVWFGRRPKKKKGENWASGIKSITGDEGEAGELCGIAGEILVPTKMGNYSRAAGGSWAGLIPENPCLECHIPIEACSNKSHSFSTLFPQNPGAAEPWFRVK